MARAWPLALVGELWHEARLAVRRLWSAPSFTLLAALSLALGLGAATAAYAVCDSLFWRNSSVPDADHLAVVTRQIATSRDLWRGVISPDDFEILRKRVRSATALAASMLLVETLNDGTRTSPFTVQAVTGSYFGVVGLPLSLGRGILDADNRLGAQPVVVLSQSFWRAKAGADSGIIGRTVEVGGRPFVVIGVAAQGMQSGLDVSGQVGLLYSDGWIPLADSTRAGSSPAVARGKPNLTVVARTSAGVPLQAFAAEVRSIGLALDDSAPLDTSGSIGGSRSRSWSVTTAAAIAREQGSGTDAAGDLVAALVSLVLLVACTNLTNMMVGRGMSRLHEIGLRRALGASGARLLRGQCAEAAVLAVLGGLGALLVASLLLRLFTTRIPYTNFQVIILKPGFSPPAILFWSGLLLASFAVFGIIPALQVMTASLRERSGSGRVAVTTTRWAGRRRLIALQVTASTALVILTIAAHRGVAVSAHHNPGFDLDHLAIGLVDLRPMQHDPARKDLAIGALAAAVRAQPEFESAALTAGLPIGTGVRVRQVARVSALEGTPVWRPAVVVAATPGIFGTLGVPIRRGRSFGDHETIATDPVIVISEGLSGHLFGTSEAVGRRIRYQGPQDAAEKAVEVIGVAGDTDTLNLFGRQVGTVYVPLAQEDTESVILVGRAANDPASLTHVFAPLVHKVDPHLAVQFASTGPIAMTPGYVVLRMAAAVSGGLSFLAIALAMLGLYGVLSHIVVSRKREIGVRLALGAERRRVLRMVINDGLYPVAWGLGIGLLLGLGAQLVLRATSAGRSISLIDPVDLVLVPVTLVASGLLAAYVPARRASRLDPNVVLREL
jgi:putative ABC transport system permease protein